MRRRIATLAAWATAAVIVAACALWAWWRASSWSAPPSLASSSRPLAPV